MERILVRDDVKRLYLSEGERWVAEVASAREFQTLDDAALKALGDRARTTSVVLVFENPRCELALSPDYCIEQTIWRGASP